MKPLDFLVATAFSVVLFLSALLAIHHDVGNAIRLAGSGLVLTLLYLWYTMKEEGGR